MIKIFIDEGAGLVDQTGRLAETSGSFTWDLSQGLRGVATIPLRTNKGDTYRPTIGAPVFIHEIVDAVDVVVWAGKILKCDRKWNGNQGYFLTTVSCGTLDSYFDMLIVDPPQSYTGMTVGAIFTDIFNKFCSDCPITLGVIEDGPTIDVDYTHLEKIRDVFDDLQTKAEKIWGIRNADQTIYLTAASTTPAPHTLTTFQYDSATFTEDQSDYRNQQTIRINFTAFGPTIEVFDGDETTLEIPTFNRIDHIVSIILTNSVRSSCVGSLGGSPGHFVVGDTVTISRSGFTAIPYTFVATLDNTEQRQVLIDDGEAGAIRNLWDAIMATPIKAGVTFSLPTWQNEFCVADFPGTGGTDLTVRCKKPGTGGDVVTVACSTGAFVWATANLTGGVDGDFTGSLTSSVVGQGSLGSDVQYVVGENVLFLNAPIQGGVSLCVAYYRSGADCITVRDSVEVAARAAVEHGPGLHAQLMNDTNNVDARAAYIKALTLLNKFKTIPDIIQCDTLRPLFEPGQLMTITLNDPNGGASVDLDGLWLLQSLSARLEPAVEKLPEPLGHFFYTLNAIKVNQIGTRVAFWETVALTAPSASQSTVNSDSTVATPKLKTLDSVPAGTPTTGAPQSTAGQQWVQEQLGPATEQEFTDLAVDASDADKVTSASYAFVSDDVGKVIQTFAGGAWSDASANITSVASGAASLDSSLAATGSTGGHWRLFDPKVLGFTWTPTRSQFTDNQVAAIIKLASDGASPATYTSVKLSPFRRSVVGYHIDAIDTDLGPDYTITGNNLTLQTKPNEGDVFITEYFPSGPKRIPPTPTPPASGQFVGLFIDSGFTTWVALTSPDGITWTSHDVPQTTSLYFNIIFGGGKYVACGGNDGSIIYSSDGITWSSATSVIPATHGIAYGGGLYVVVGWHSGGVGGSEGTGYIMTSPDAITWTARTCPNNNQWSDVCFHDGLFVAVATIVHTAGTGQIMTSTDGITWTVTAAPAVKQWSNIRFGNGLFIAGAHSSGSTQGVMTSPDGVTWTLQTTPSPNRAFEGVAYGAGTFAFACSSPSGVLAVTSPDGATWSDVSESTDSSFGVTFGNGLFVLTTFFGGASEQIWTSPDGVTWTARSSSADGGGALCICFGD